MKTRYYIEMGDKENGREQERWGVGDRQTDRGWGWGETETDRKKIKNYRREGGAETDKRERGWEKKMKNYRRERGTETDRQKVENYEREDGKEKERQAGRQKQCKSLYLVLVSILGLVGQWQVGTYGLTLYLQKEYSALIKQDDIDIDTAWTVAGW